jgi:hypothetical protein
VDDPHRVGPAGVLGAVGLHVAPRVVDDAVETARSQCLEDRLVEDDAAGVAEVVHVSERQHEIQVLDEEGQRREIVGAPLIGRGHQLVDLQDLDGGQIRVSVDRGGQPRGVHGRIELALLRQHGRQQTRVPAVAGEQLEHPQVVPETEKLQRLPGQAVGVPGPIRRRARRIGHRRLQLALPARLGRRRHGA